MEKKPKKSSKYRHCKKCNRDTVMMICEICDTILIQKQHEKTKQS